MPWAVGWPPGSAVACFLAELLFAICLDVDSRIKSFSRSWQRCLLELTRLIDSARLVLLLVDYKLFELVDSRWIVIGCSGRN